MRFSPPPALTAILILCKNETEVEENISQARFSFLVASLTYRLVIKTGLKGISNKHKTHFGMHDLQKNLYSLRSGMDQWIKKMEISVFTS